MNGERTTLRLIASAAVAALLVMLAACTSTVVRETIPTTTPAATGGGTPGVSTVVQRGDTLYGIAFRNGLDFRDLAAWNAIGPPYTIYPGQNLRLRPPGKVAAAPTPRPPAGVVTRPATPPAQTQPAPKPAAPVAASPAPVPVNSGFAWQWPADGTIISRFTAGDATRQGIGIAGNSGQPVRAAAAGVVVYSGAGLVGYGELIIIKHSDTWLSAYGHNRKRLVNEGQNVAAGQQIAEMGRSGAARDMLHFEIRYNGKPQDPLLYLPRR